MEYCIWCALDVKELNKIISISVRAQYGVIAPPRPVSIVS